MVIQDHCLAMNKLLEIDDTFSIEGGISFSGAILTAIISGIKVIRDLGRSFGTTIRRLTTGNLCEL